MSAYLSEQGKDPSQFDFDEPASHENTGGDKEMTDEPVTEAQDETTKDTTVTEGDKEETKVTTDASLVRMAPLSDRHHMIGNENLKDVAESNVTEKDDSSVDKSTTPPSKTETVMTAVKDDDSSAPPVEVSPECKSAGDAEMTSPDKAANENVGVEQRDEMQADTVEPPSDEKEGMC